MKRIWIISLLTALLTGTFAVPLPAAEIQQFAMHYSPTMDAKDCALVRRYSGESMQQESLPGLHTDESCSVIFPLREFEERFQFCYLAGFNLYKAQHPEMVECVIQKRENDYIFSASGGKDSGVDQVMCYFTCIGNSNTPKSTD